MSSTGFLPGFRTDRPATAVAAARLTLWWERVWRASWPASGFAGLFCAAAWCGLFSVIPGWLHMALLAAALFGFAASVFFVFRPFTPPGAYESARKVERDSALAHRPLSEETDALASGANDPWAEELWNAHAARRAALTDLRVGAPHPALAASDRHRLRFVVLALMAVGLVIAGPRWSSRLAAAFDPALDAGAALPTLDAWIDPPSYTGEAPLYLSASNAGTLLSAPQGSRLHLRVHGADDTPYLALAPAQPRTTPAFAGGDREYAAAVTLSRSGELRVRADGRRIGAWRIRVVPDNPPQIMLTAKPVRTPQNLVRLAFTAGDDYGVTGLRAIIAPVTRKGRAVLTEIPLAEPSAKTLKATVAQDWQDSPYAGLDVSLTLEARDAAGQTARSKAVRFTLPARFFTNPLARALVEQRQNLGIDGARARMGVVRALDALSIAPDRFYQNQTSAYLAIRAAFWTLHNSGSPDAITRAEDLLWQTALALEQGGLSLAAEELRRVQQMLTEALARGASQDEIEALMQRYRQALQRYLQSMAANNGGKAGSPPPGTKVLTEKDLEQLMTAIEQLAQTGARGEAAQMLALLQSLLENMQMASGGGGEGNTPSPGDKATTDAIQNLGQLLGKQRELLDKTLREQEGAGDPKDGGAKGLAQQQGKLNEQLKQIQKGLGDSHVKVPGDLSRAGKSMGSAQGQLGSRDLDNAGGSQKNAIDALRSGADALAKAMLGKNGQGQEPGSREGLNGEEDPLGRMQGGHGPMTGNSVKVPDQSALDRARAILKELRRRAAERGRSQEELDYIDRLLRSF